MSENSLYRAFCQKIVGNRDTVRHFEVQFYQRYIGEIYRRAPTIGSILTQEGVRNAALSFPLQQIRRCIPSLGLQQQPMTEAGPGNLWHLVFAEGIRSDGKKGMRPTILHPIIHSANEALMLSAFATVAFNELLKSQSDGEAPIAALHLEKPKIDGAPYRPLSIELLAGPREGVRTISIELLDRFASRASWAEEKDKTGKTPPLITMIREIPALF